ncbi:MAG: four helix bundle protein [Planctomycetes bacterium]|nr:four helix bundle protein [Planctomycetota bacterium]
MNREVAKLEVYRKAHALLLEVYRAVEKMPEEEQEGLAVDIGRAVLAIPANIARGCVFEDEDEFRECLEVSREASRELEMLLLVMQDLGYLSASECERLNGLNDEVRKLLKKETSKGRIRSS